MRLPQIPQVYSLILERCRSHGMSCLMSRHASRRCTRSPRPGSPTAVFAGDCRFSSTTSRDVRTVDLTSGRENLMSAVERFIASDAADRCLLVTGNYGDGKSHSLTLIADMARSAGLATCHLSADGTIAALNHPQRFLPQLL